MDSLSCPRCGAEGKEKDSDSMSEGSNGKEDAAGMRLTSFANEQEYSNEQESC